MSLANLIANPAASIPRMNRVDENIQPRDAMLALEKLLNDARHYAYVLHRAVGESSHAFTEYDREAAETVAYDLAAKLDAAVRLYYQAIKAPDAHA